MVQLFTRHKNEKYAEIAKEMINKYDLNFTGKYILYDGQKLVNHTPTSYEAAIKTGFKNHYHFQIDNVYSMLQLSALIIDLKDKPYDERKKILHAILKQQCAISKSFLSLFKSLIEDEKNYPVNVSRQFRHNDHAKNIFTYSDEKLQYFLSIEKIINQFEHPYTSRLRF